jgi:hypothetical protein
LPYVLGYFGVVLISLAAAGAVFLATGQVPRGRSAARVAAVTAAVAGLVLIGGGAWASHAAGSRALVGNIQQRYSVTPVGHVALGDTVTVRTAAGATLHCRLTGAAFDPLLTCGGQPLRSGTR